MSLHVFEVTTCLAKSIEITDWSMAGNDELALGTEYGLRVVGYFKINATPLITRSTLESAITTIKV